MYPSRRKRERGERTVRGAALGESQAASGAMAEGHFTVTALAGDADSVARGPAVTQPSARHDFGVLPHDEDPLDEDPPALSVTREDVESLMAAGVAPTNLIARFPDIAQAPAADIPGWGLALIRRTNPKPGTSRYLYVANEGMFHVQPMYGGEHHMVAKVERSFGHVVHDVLAVSPAQMQRVLGVYRQVDELLGSPRLDKTLEPTPQAVATPSASPSSPVVSVKRRRMASA